MKCAYKLQHKRFIETDSEGDKICDTNLLGFFSSEENYKTAIAFYLKLPGFKDFPDDFVVEKVEADVDDYNENVGEFASSVFYLSHEWYDDEYDYVSCLGYYSSMKNAEKSQALYQLEPEYIAHPEGFCIDEYKIDEREWTEGFFTY